MRRKSINLRDNLESASMRCKCSRENSSSERFSSGSISSSFVSRLGRTESSGTDSSNSIVEGRPGSDLRRGLGILGSSSSSSIGDSGGGVSTSYGSRGFRLLPFVSYCPERSLRWVSACHSE